MSEDFNTSEYWEMRYRSGRDSGRGSYGLLAEFKADVLNTFVASHGVRMVLEWGCGDGNQLRFAQYPWYLGLDVSEAAVEKCRMLFRGDSTKRFELTGDYGGEIADLALSLDVLYHLVEDDLFTQYLDGLFASSRRWVIIYAADIDRPQDNPHVKMRKFTGYIDETFANWRLHSIVLNKFRGNAARFYGGPSSPSDFFVFERFR